MSWTKPPSDKNPKNPSSVLLHYCRTCEHQFESTDRESAHLLALGHHIHDHDKKRQYVRCSSRCEFRAQPEEIIADHRMYGPGVQRPTERPKNRYTQLFPKEED